MLSVRALRFQSIFSRHHLVSSAFPNLSSRFATFFHQSIEVLGGNTSKAQHQQHQLTSFLIDSRCASTQMPGKNATTSKRKVAESAAATKTLKDHFMAAASKRSKKDAEDEDQVVEEAVNKMQPATAATDNTTLDDEKKESKATSKDVVATAPTKTKTASIFLKAKKASKKSKGKEDEGNDCDDDNDEDAEEESKVQKESRYNKADFIRPSDGKGWNFKIVSFNVNGVRAWLQVSRFVFQMNK